jgi:hypothetical protein
MTPDGLLILPAGHPTVAARIASLRVAAAESGSCTR